MILNGIFIVLRTGIPWRNPPEQYGPYATVYNRVNRWAARGIWSRIFEALAASSRDSLQLVDSTVLKAHPAAAEAKAGCKQALGISRRDRATKIHALVDGRGRQFHFFLTGG